ncbi:hypothetical protein ACX27_11120 [Nostoc piscinale CENA21]|uniref:Uncharacterized protein n=1 Tax=Nostoc piscinale CENA21 TaxID=224013 RepID=A0A0M4SR69_9NOSO|nr:hypothetical protein ACX27_11120 [Nostoc piscinale CENA21]
MRDFEMTIAYHNSKDNEEVFPEVEARENQAVNNLTTNNYHIAQDFKLWRQQLQAISNVMRQARDVDTLLKLSVAQIREKN